MALGTANVVIGMEVARGGAWVPQAGKHRCKTSGGMALEVVASRIHLAGALYLKSPGSPRKPKRPLKLGVGANVPACPQMVSHGGTSVEHRVCLLGQGVSAPGGGRAAGLGCW